MRSANYGVRKALLASSMFVASVALGGCATEEYVNIHIAAVNARIDQTDGRLGALEGRVNDVSQRADAAGSAAQAAGAAAQAAGTAAGAAAADAQRANQGVDELRPLVAHLETHHKHQTWRDVNTRRHAAKHTKHKASKRAKKTKS